MTRPYLGAALLLLGLHTGAAQAAAAAPLATIPALDLQRYLGTWYEIARFPNDFQKKCVGDTTATYSLREDGRVAVVNRCRTQDGGAEVAEGVARQRGPAASPKLEVRFAPAILSFLPMVWGDYWVIDLDQGYQLSAVSEPKREYLWILSRTPQVDPAAYEALLGRLRAQGLDTGKLVRTRQGQ
ncbi:lipocalin family protein [Massilia sp. ST3]|uniref:lipocalin family protein n=1 Tax=Massilia sp. ST3 TaxID=2824903 RepID=UPI001B832408|nr:lipocalin family protein [Massilia sp. ST3]MBQ5947326.1 lipocalin family protein [Massilia sp. ST3]